MFYAVTKALFPRKSSQMRLGLQHMINTAYVLLHGLPRGFSLPPTLPPRYQQGLNEIDSSAVVDMKVVVP